MMKVYQGLNDIILHLIFAFLLLEEHLPHRLPVPHHPGVLCEVRDDGHRVRSLLIICLHHLHQLERGLGTEFVPPECCVVCADRNGILWSIVNYSSKVSRESPINRPRWLWRSHINWVSAINMRPNTAVDYRLLRKRNIRKEKKRRRELSLILKPIRSEWKQNWLICCQKKIWEENKILVWKCLARCQNWAKTKLTNKLTDDHKATQGERERESLMS